jgi:hypothetical protein
MIEPEIIVFDTNPSLIRVLEASLRLPFISFAVGTGPDVVKSKNLDALWLTPMQAERYGAMPPFPLYAAQILVTPEVEVRKGFSRLVMTGVAISMDDPRDPQWQLRIVVSALARAIKQGAETRTFLVRRVGMLPEDLFLHKLSVSEASPIIEEAYRACYPATRS